MVDVSAVSGALSSLKALKDLAETMMNLRDATAFQQKRFELQSLIIDAQNGAITINEERSTLLDRVRDLEKKIADMENWERDKEQYELKDIGQGVVAYARKESVDVNAPTHFLCANCFEQRQKGHLQRTSLSVGRAEIVLCQRCGATDYVRGHAMNEHANILSKLRGRS